MIAGEFYKRTSGLTGRPHLATKMEGGNIIVSWDAGRILQTATNVVGPWLTIDNASSPYSVIGNESMRFFRVVSSP